MAASRVANAGATRTGLEFSPRGPDAAGIEELSMGFSRFDDAQAGMLA